MKKLFSVIMAVIMLETSLGVGARAVEPKTGSLNIMTYNVSGIPVLGDYQGTQRDLQGNARMAKMGEILNNESGCELIGTQEDFDLHAALAKAMPAYIYQTQTSGGVPLGDGLSIFSKFPVYNVKRTKWNKSYGVVSAGTDRLAQKGILSSVIEISDGVYIDFYVLHADAGNDIKSAEARADNYRQLADMINSRAYDRAAIVVGDFNTTFDRNQVDDLYNILVKPAGLSDCWAQIYNNGSCSYNNGVGWNPSYYETYDKIMFKSGGGVELNAESLQYIQYTNDQGKTYTDHNATKACIIYKITGDTTNTEVLKTEEPIDSTQRMLDEFTAVIRTLVLIFTNLNELGDLIGEGLAYLKQGG
jgi:exonuclease III